MIILSHVIVGATIAKTIPNPWIAAPLAFASHFLLDMIPHAQEPTDDGYKPNRRTYLFAGLDLTAVIVFLYFFGLTANSFVVILASVLPDILDLSRYNAFFYKTFKWTYDFHDKIQNETWKPVGYVTQFLLIAGCLLLIFWRF